MKTEVNENTLASIKNPVFREYAGQYIRINQQFIELTRQSGMEFDTREEDENYVSRAEALRKKGAVVRNDSKSIYNNRISSACLACQTGEGSTTFFISLKCHRDCFYCFNPNQEGYEYFRDHKRDVVAELQALDTSGAPVRHLALTGGEPLLEKEETIRFFQEARHDFPDVYTRLYTCGDHLDRSTLQDLKDAGMNEIRFSLRIQDTPKAQQHTYDQIALAREYIPNVMVEMPVLPGKFEEMKGVLKELERLEIFGINLLELCFPLHNAEEFRKRGYRIKSRPFRVLYNYWYAGSLPVAGSESECLDLVAYALEEGFKLGVHYCSLENKNTGQIYQQNNIRPLPKTMYFSPNDYFLKSAKVFGEDVVTVENFFKKSGNGNYEINEEHNYLEFHVSQIRSLKNFEIEVGLSSNVFETRDGDRYVRELKVDLTTPQTFRLSKDI